MVTTVTHYTDPRNRANVGEGYDGVVRVSVGNSFGTGSLLFDGRAILTAAHLFPDSSVKTAHVHFETSAGEQTLIADRITILSTYDDEQGNDDLAIVWLTSSAPLEANRYNLYRGSDEIGKTMTMVGYGTPGSGSTGAIESYTGPYMRLKASNQFDTDATTVKSWVGSGMGWTPSAGSQLVADFDNGTSDADALGRLTYRTGTGLGADEGMSSTGDSGGPAFINGQIAGVTSYGASVFNGSTDPDIDTKTNSSFGELGFWQRVSHFQQWIDQTVRAQYVNAPKTAADVQKSVSEGSGGTAHVYFLLQFTGMRSDPKQSLSVDYATRDGTAKAGEDYISASGKLILYPNETQAVIPVEIIGDVLSEPDETLYMDVTNPVGGSFGEGVVRLTAMRTILNDDGSLWS
jgi:hypothetical protein